MSEILRSFKTYTLIDFLKIPLRVCPILTIIIGVNRIVSALMPAVTVLTTAYFVDTAVAIFNDQQSYNSIYTPMFYLFLIVLYRQMNGTLIGNFVNIRYDMATFRYFRSAMVEKRSRLDYKHIENNDTWNLVTRTCNDPLGKLATGMNNLFDIVETVLIIGSILLILFTQVWWAGLTIMAITIPLLFLAARGGKEIYQANVEAEKINRREAYYNRILRDRENVEERALFRYSDAINTKWSEKYEEARIVNLKAAAKNFIKMKGASLITVAISLGIIGVLLMILSKGAISIGIFVALTTATFDLVQMMSWRLSYVVRTLAENREYLKDLTKFMGLSEREGALDLPADVTNLTFESIEFRDVSFKYPDTDKYILKNFSLRLTKNRHYAFVGINGAGKTTITKLLTGMFDNYTGDIYINDRNLREYSLAELKAIFAVVYQDFAKYYITAKDNIAIGDARSMDEEQEQERVERDIQAAITTMDMRDVVEKLPDGLHTYLGKIKENGVDLSGGQWQRLAIARALYNPALVRILDEPTAALDPVAESNLYQMFGEISKGRTTIFITHRLGAAKLADEIIVVDSGKVAEKGDHKQLLDLGGIYSNMFESQRSWYQA